jgi:hypothetical protein
MKTREQMETALWLTDRFSEPDLKAMTDDEVKEAYDRFTKVARHHPALKATLDLSDPPALTPEQVFALWERLSPDDIAFVQQCMKNDPGLTLAECLQELNDFGGI